MPFSDYRNQKLLDKTFYGREVGAGPTRGLYIASSNNSFTLRLFRLRGILELGDPP